MDKVKQPGIKFDGIILVKEEFWRDHVVGNNLKTGIKFESLNQVIDNNATVEITSILSLMAEDKEVVKLESTFVGFFSINIEEENMNLNDYIKNNSAALMFPYIREHITAVTAKSGINPIMLPPLNLVAILNNVN